MVRPAYVRLVALAALLLSFLLDVVPVVSSMPFLQMCGLGDDWVCNKNIDTVPVEVVQVCEACGNFWGNVPGFAYCCRCSEKVFSFCLVAVFDYN